MFRGGESGVCDLQDVPEEEAGRPSELSVQPQAQEDCERTEDEHLIKH